MPFTTNETDAIAADVVRVLEASSVKGTTGTSSGSRVSTDFDHIAFELVVTAVSGVGGDTLNVYVQQSYDGSNYDDLVSFAQLTGAAAAQVQSAGMSVYPVSQAPEVHTHSSGVLAAGTVRTVLLARNFRVRWVVAGGGGGSTWTFEVLALPRVRRILNGK